jgi:hypothetical protein
MMYQADLIRARREINSYQDYDVPNWISWCASFLAFVPNHPVLTIASSITAITFGITATIASDNLEEREDLFTQLVEETIEDGLLYVTFKQDYLYIKNGKGEGWIQDGSPRISRHYTDY